MHVYKKPIMIEADTSYKHLITKMFILQNPYDVALILVKWNGELKVAAEKEEFDERKKFVI